MGRPNSVWVLRLDKVASVGARADTYETDTQVAQQPVKTHASQDAEDD